MQVQYATEISTKSVKIVSNMLGEKQNKLPFCENSYCRNNRVKKRLHRIEKLIPTN